MNLFQISSYRGTEDLQVMLSFLSEVRPRAWSTDYPSPADLHELFGDPHLQPATRLWWDAQGRLAAFAFLPRSYTRLYFEARPEILTKEFEDEILEWAAGCARNTNRSAGQPPELVLTSRTDDRRRMAMLKRHDFLQQEDHYAGLVRDLSQPLPAPRIPARFSIRPVAGEQEAGAIAALHRAAFGTPNMTVEGRLAIMRAPQYDPSLDLLVCTPDDRIMAYCTCWISAEENKLTGRRDGHADPIATHPDYQRLGLARALLLSGMARLKERGIERVITGTSSDNVAMLKTAASVGFVVETTRLWFAKSLET